MIKICSPAGWKFCEQIATLVKVASGGLRGNDRLDFVKRASGSESVFLPFLDQVKFARDEEPVHYLAVGAYERWGFNRNGDGFKEADCKDHHHTFVKFGSAYRNHKNKPPDNPSYGTIKLSAYNPEMQRIELLIGLNKTKEAAERNGGFVADKELEKLARGEDLAGSMACRIERDFCSYCNNGSRTRDEYCTREKCAAGGCAANLSKLVKVANDVHHLGVFNPRPTFFDWSTVFKPAERTAYGNRADWATAFTPAERTAYGNRADWFTKAAEDGGVFDKTAEELGITAPLPVVLYRAGLSAGHTAEIEEQIKLAHAITEAEALSAFRLPAEIDRAFAGALQPAFDFAAAEIDPNDRQKTAAALGALADQKIILPLRDFACLTKRAGLAELAAPRVAGAYGRMLEDGSLVPAIAQSTFAPADALASPKQKQAAVKFAAAYSLSRQAVQERCVRSRIRGLPVPAKSIFGEKQAAEISPAAETLARDYAVYKLAALRRIATFDSEFALTVKAAMAQNGVI